MAGDRHGQRGAEGTLLRLGRGPPGRFQPARRGRTGALTRIDLLLQIGLIELAVGAILGWAMVMKSEKPEWLKAVGVVRSHRILQVHLDFLLMGLILIAVGLVVPDPPALLQAMLIFGTVMNPALFIPLAFDPDSEKKLWYRSLAVLSFIAVSGGLAWAAILGP